MRTERTSARICISIREHREHGYYHVSATPMALGLRPAEIRAIDENRPYHKNVERDDVRSIDDTYNGLYLESLRVWSQGCDTDITRNLYGWVVEYSDTTASLDLHKTARMAKTLKMIQQRMDTSANLFGRPESFGAYVLRVAHAIGANQIVFWKADGKVYPSGKPYTLRDPRSGMDMINNIITEWTEGVAA